MLWPRPELEGFHYEVGRLRSKTELGVHILQEAGGFDVEPVRHILLGQEVRRADVAEITDLLRRARVMAVDEEDDMGMIAARAVLTTGPMTGYGHDTTLLSMRLRVAPNGLNEKLTVRIVSPVLKRMVEVGWGYGVLGGPDVLNGEEGVGPDNPFHVALRLAAAYRGLLRVFTKPYLVAPAVPEQTRRHPVSVVDRRAVVA